MSIDAVHNRASSHQSLFPSTLTQQHCVVLWIGKNYRLQDIQLSKTAREANASRISGPGDVPAGERTEARSKLRSPLARQPALASRVRVRRRVPSGGWWRIPGSNR
jgi:hypothetical protein